jgi:hypothetical protein
LYGYIRLDGTVAIRPQYMAAGVFDNDVAIVRSGGGSRSIGIINRNGDYVIPPVFSGIQSATGTPRILLRKDGRWGIVDLNGDWIVRPGYEGARGGFSEGVAAMAYRGKWGFVDPNGTWTIEPRFDAAFPMSEGVAVVLVEDGWGVVDEDGQWRVQPHFAVDVYDDEYPRRCQDGLINMRVGKHWGYVDANGAVKIEPEYLLACPFMEDRGVVGIRKNGLWYWVYIDQDGTRISNRMYRDARYFQGGIAPVKYEGRWGAIEKQGRWAIRAKYEDLVTTPSSMCLAREDGKWGLLDREGHTLVQFEYDRFITMSDEGVCLMKNGRATWWLNMESGLVAVTLKEQERRRLNIPTSMRPGKRVTTQPTTQPADR